MRLAENFSTCWTTGHRCLPHTVSETVLNVITGEDIRSSLWQFLMEENGHYTLAFSGSINANGWTGCKNIRNKVNSALKCGGWPA